MNTELLDTEQLLTTAQELATTFGVKIIAALAIFIIGRWIAKALATALRKGLERAEVDPMLVKFIGNLGYALLLTFVVLAAIGQLGVQTASFIAVLGAAGLAIGLALQGSLANFAAGVLVIIFRPYKIGDYVEAAGVSGTVEEVQIFTTVLKTPDNKRIIVPNGQMTAGTITNYSSNPTRRVDVTASIGYGDDIDKAQKVLMDIVAADDRIHEEPEPFVRVSALGASSVDFAVRVWVDSGDYWPVYFDLTERIKKRFDDEGISIPFPQQDVHIYQHAALQRSA